MNRLYCQCWGGYMYQHYVLNTQNTSNCYSYCLNRWYSAVHGQECIS